MIQMPPVVWSTLFITIEERRRSDEEWDSLFNLRPKNGVIHAIIDRRSTYGCSHLPSKRA